VNIYFSSIANLKCTPSDRQMYPLEYMYPRLRTSALSFGQGSQVAYFISTA